MSQAKERSHSKSNTLLNFYNKRNPKFITNNQFINDIDFSDTSKQVLKPQTGDVFSARSKLQTDSLQQSVERLNDFFGSGHFKKNPIKIQDATNSASSFFPSLRTKSDGLINVTGAANKKLEDEIPLSQNIQIPPRFLLSSTSDWKKYMVEQGEGPEKIKQLEFISRQKLQADRRQISTSMSYRHDISHNLDGPKKNLKSMGPDFRKFFVEEVDFSSMNQKIPNTKNVSSTDMPSLENIRRSDQTDYAMSPSTTPLDKNFFAYFLYGSRKHKKQIKPNKYLTLSNHEVTLEQSRENTKTPTTTTLELETQALLQGEEVNLEFLLNLRREVPNSFTEAPSGRQDAILLTKWLDKCIPYLFDGTHSRGNNPRVNDLLREVHNIAFKEVLREVSLQCQERGALLSKIWDFFEKLRREEEKEFSNKIEMLKQEHDDTYNRIHKIYKTKLEDKEKAIDNMKLDTEKTLTQNINLGRQLNLSQQRESELGNKLAEYQKIIQIMKKRIKYMNSTGEKDMQPPPPIRKDAEGNMNSGFFQNNEKEQKRSRAETLPNLIKKSSQIKINSAFENPQSNSLIDKTKILTTKVSSENNQETTGEAGDDKKAAEIGAENHQALVERTRESPSNQRVTFKEKNTEESDLLPKTLNSVESENFEKSADKLEEANTEEQHEDDVKRENPMSTPDNAEKKLEKKKSVGSNDSLLESEGDDKIEIDNQEFNVNLLNTVVIHTVADKLIKHAEASTEVDLVYFEFCRDSKMTQTELTLLGSKFDNAFKNNRNVEEMIDDFVYKGELEALANEVNLANPDETFLDKLKEFSMKNYEKSEHANFEEIEKAGLAKIKSPSLKDKKIRGKVKIISRMAAAEKKRESEKKRSLRQIIQREDMIKIVGENRNKKNKGKNPTDSDYVKSNNDGEGVEETENNKKDDICNGEITNSPPESTKKVIKMEQYSSNDNDEYKNGGEEGNSQDPEEGENENADNEGLSDYISGSEEEFDEEENLGIIREEDDEGIVAEQEELKRKETPQDTIRRVVKLRKDPVTGKLVDNFERKVERKSSSYILQMEMLKMMKVFQTKTSKLNDMESKLIKTEELLNKEASERYTLEKINKDLNITLENEQKRIEKLKFEGVGIGLPTQESQLDKNNEGDRSVKNSSPTRKTIARKSLRRGMSSFQSGLAIGPKLGQKVTVEFEHKKLAQYGMTLVEKVMNKKMSKFKNFMFLKLILKQILMLYNERISQGKENNFVKEQNMASFAYTVLHSQFGLKKIADQKFIIFLLSIRKTQSYFRINMFARFMNLGPGPSNYTVDELNKYLDAMDFIVNQSNLGTTVVNIEGEPKFYVPYVRAIQYTGLFADSRMTPEENSELKKEIETLREADPKAVNKNGIIDFDLFMEKMLSKYRFLVNKAKTYVINAFAASDLDGNGMCNLEEFLLLNRHMEPDKFDEEKFERIFEENADLESEGQKNLSFNKFSVVCVEYMLFSDEAQDKYLGIEDPTKADELMANMIKSIRLSWALSRMQIESRFNNLTIITAEEKENWIKIISVLDQRITAPDINQILKPTLIAYNILEKESEMLEESQNEQKNLLNNESVENKFSEFEAL